MKKLLPILLIVSTFCFFTPYAHAVEAIAFDHETTIAASSGSMTINSGTHNALFCFEQNFSNNNIPTSITVGGNNMTKITSVTGGISNFEMSLWVYLTPPTGSQTITASGGSTDTMYCNQYTGVNQSLSYTGGGQTDNAYSLHTTNCSSPQTINTVPIKSNSWILGASTPSSYGNSTSGNTLTNRNGSPSYYFEGDSNGTVAGSTDVSFTYKGGPSANCMLLTATVSPFVSGAASSFNFWHLF